MMSAIRIVDIDADDSRLFLAMATLCAYRPHACGAVETVRYNVFVVLRTSAKQITAKPVM